MQIDIAFGRILGILIMTTYEMIDFKEFCIKRVMFNFSIQY